MDELIFVPLIVLVVAVVAWLWVARRKRRDPVSSVDSFHRALHAMEPSQAPATREAGRSTEQERADRAVSADVRVRYGDGLEAAPGAPPSEGEDESDRSVGHDQS